MTLMNRVSPAVGAHVAWLHGIPVPIAALFAIDVTLILIPLVDFWLGSPFRELRKLINLDGETTVQAWYSSMQWFCAGALFGLFTLYAYRRRLRGLLAMAAFALVCIVFSIDEIAGIHEWLGHKSDALLPGGQRAQSGFSRTGIWPFVIGLPVLAAVVVIVQRMRHLFVPASPRALRLLAAGLVIMFTGALLVELGANLIDRSDSPGLNLAQLMVEEFLEMFGVSYIVWAAYELLHAHGFALKMPASMTAAPSTAATSAADSTGALPAA